MKFLVDNQLPSALARFLGARGEDCKHVLDLGLAQATDKEIWRYASTAGLVLISKDEDFVHLAKQAGATVQLIWVRVGNCRNPALLGAIERGWPAAKEAIGAGERVVEVR